LPQRTQGTQGRFSDPFFVFFGFLVVEILPGPTLRLSGSPKPLQRKKPLWRVRPKRWFGGVLFRRTRPPTNSVLVSELSLDNF
jgi:hypothetical protein